MRLSYILAHQRFQDGIDWQGGTYVLSGTKNGDDRVVYLGSWALTVLRGRQTRLFGASENTMDFVNTRNMDFVNTRKGENSMDFVTVLAKTSTGPHATNSRGAYAQRP